MGGLARRHGRELALLSAGIAITIVIRIKLLGYSGGDLRDGFLGWCNDIEKKGFAKALIGGDCNYNASYMYVLWLATKLPFERALVLKGFTILCDYVAAAALALVVLRASQSRLRALLAGFAVLVAPTVVFNGALWGQCDMVYVAPLSVGLAALLWKRTYLAAAMFGLAISVKLQAIFLFPLVGLWVVRRELRPRALAMIPVAFLATLVPAWLAGCKWVDLLMIYPRQAQQYSGLTLNAPTIFALLPDQEKWIEPFGLWFAVACLFMVFSACLYARARSTATVLVREALAFASLAPYLLPHMHERYLFAADVTSVAYAFVFPGRLWVALCVVGASFAGYASFLFDRSTVPLSFAAAMMGGASLFVTVDMLKVHFPNAFRSVREGEERPVQLEASAAVGAPAPTEKRVATGA